MAAIRGFRDLIVYQRALKEAKKVFQMSKRFPAEEKYSLTDQIRRSSRAVGSMLAEAWARRRYQAAFISKTVEALGEAMETQSWLDHAIMCGYIERDEYRESDGAWQEVGAMLQGMIDQAPKFCRPDRRA
jgi:four helix bundle protein